MNTRVRRPLFRLAASAAVLLLAFLIGWAAHSAGVFVAVLGIGLVAQTVLRFTLWR